MNAFNSECKADPRHLKFFVPVNWIYSNMSFQTQPQPLN